MVRIGIAGIGFMGVTHYKAIAKVKHAKVRAICTRDKRKLNGDWRSVQGNFGASGGMQKLSEVACYETLQDLLNDDSIDLVHICLPTNLHVEWTLKAFAAGKHVFLEKPIALTLADANRLVTAAKSAGVCFMVAHVLRFFPEFRLLKNFVSEQKYGRVLAAHFKRVISRPVWWDPKNMMRTGGPAIDLHIHDADFVRYLFGMPDAVSSTGVIGRGDVVEHLDTLYHFESGPTVSAHAGWLAQSACKFEHGYDVYFENATLKYNSSTGQSPIILSPDGRIRKPRLPGQDGFVGEIQEAVDAIRKGSNCAILSGENGRDSLKLCLREIRSVRTGRRVVVDN